VSVYTAYDMIADCRAGKPEGWLWFARNFVPPLRMLLAHYSAGDPDAALQRLVAGMRSELAATAPAPLREIVVALRPKILEAAGFPGETPPVPVDIDTLSEAFEPLTFAERQMVWLETMRYNAADTARLMRASAETVENVRRRAGELLRAKLDHWTVTLLLDSGAALGEEVRRSLPAEPVATRDFLDLVDGRVTWQHRGEIERALAGSWFEVDHLCRVREVDEAVARTRPLEDADAAPYYAMLGVEPVKPSRWRRLLS
jgi:hypothetical protein